MGGPPSRHPLRVGLLLDGRRVPAWVHRIVEELGRSPVAGISLVVVRRAPASRPGPLRRAWGKRRHLLYELYSRIDRRLFRLAPDPFARRDLGPLLDGVPVLEVVPRATRFSDRLEPDDVAAVRDHDLDVLLRFGFRILRGEILTAARHGVWSYHHGDSHEIRGGPPGFWEVVGRRPVTGSVLQVLSDELDGGRAIYRSWAPTHRRSVIRNRYHVYWKSTAFVGRCLEALVESGDPAAGAAATVDESTYRPYSAGLFRKPGNAEAARILPPLVARAGTGAIRDRLTRKQWFLAWRFTGEAAPATELFRLKPLLPPPDRFWADPFPVHHEGRWYVFFEEYRFRERRGHLRVLEIDPERGPSPSRRVLTEAHHLSYPFLVRHRGELLLVPESAAAGRVCAYRCVRFPDEWSLEAVLLDGVHAVDATLHEEDGRWWMFVAIAVPGALHAHDELHLFHAPSPLGPWEPVAGNPVKSDARSARPAGKLFRWKGDLYRPAQDCSRRYGHSIVLHRVRRLDLGGYEEEAVGRIEPDWRPGLLATHTFNHEAGLTVVDGMRRVLARPGWA